MSFKCNQESSGKQKLKVLCFGTVPGIERLIKKKTFPMKDFKNIVITILF